MNNKDQAVLFTLTSMQKLLTDNDKIATDIPESVVDSTSLDDNIIKANVADLIKGKIMTINAADVEAAKFKMSKTLFTYIGKAQVICGQSNNEALLNKFNFSVNYIIKANKGNATLRAKEIKELISNNLTELTNIKAADLIVITTDIAGYDTIKNIPTLNIKSKKNFGTVAREQALTDGRACAERLHTSIKSQYQDSDPELVKASEEILKVVILGVRYSPVDITFIDSVTLLPVPSCKFQRTLKSGKIKVFYASIDGISHFKTHKAGKTTYSVNNPGYTIKSFSITVKRSVTNAFSITVIPTR